METKESRAIVSRQIAGIALRDSRDKSVLVGVTVLKRHPIYQKRYTISKKFLVHTDFDIKKGETLKICQTRPISKKIAWIVCSKPAAIQKENTEEK